MNSDYEQWMQGVKSRLYMLTGIRDLRRRQLEQAERDVAAASDALNARRLEWLAR